MDEENVPLDPATIRACARELVRLAPATYTRSDWDSLNLTARTTLIHASNQTILNYHQLMRLLEPERNLTVSLGEFKQILAQFERDRRQ